MAQREISRAEAPKTKGQKWGTPQRMPARESHRTLSPWLSYFHFCDKIPGGKKAMNWAGRRKGGPVGGRAEDGREGLFKKEYSPSPCGAAADCPTLQQEPEVLATVSTVRKRQERQMPLVKLASSLSFSPGTKCGTALPTFQLCLTSVTPFWKPSQTHRWIFSGWS